MGRSRDRKTKKHLHTHAFRRVTQRYGLVLSIDDLDDMVLKIARQSPGTRFVFKESLNRKHYDVQLRGMVFRVVYDKARGAIVTALPPEAVDPPIQPFKEDTA